MFLKLYSPHKRGRKYWIARGSYKGKRYEYSTGETIKERAKIVAEEFERKIKSRYQNGGPVIFAIAAQAYIDYRNPSDRDRKWISRLKIFLGSRPVDEINQHDLVDLANSFYGEGHASSKNRSVIRPAASILHYAAENKWCPWLRIKAFKEPEAQTRYVGEDVEKKLLNATIGEKHLLILWLFKQGDRISDALGVKYEDCDLKKRTVRRHIGKSDKWATLPLNDQICRLLAGKNEGYIFPWRTRWGVNKWLRPLCKQLGVEFTPHRARHTLGKRLNDSGVALKTIMQVLGQKDPKSAIRYQTTGIEEMRRAKKKSGA